MIKDTHEHKSMCVYKHWKLVHSNSVLPELGKILNRIQELEDKHDQFLISKQKCALRRCLVQWRSNTTNQTILQDFEARMESQATEYFKQRKARI